MNKHAKWILIGSVTIVIVILGLLMPEGGSAAFAEFAFTRFGVLALVATLGFIALIVIFSNKDKK